MKVIITEDQIEVIGFDDVNFENENLGNCRDVARFALAWASRKIADDLEKDLSGDWESQITVLD